MEMQQVRYFIAVAETLNFTRAAEQCNVSQPALTRAIKLLEGELGGDLIRREGRLSHLTDLGKRMLPPLKNCYDSALNAKALAKSWQKGEIPTLNVAVSKIFDIALLMPALSEIYSVFPDIHLNLKRGAGSEMKQMLEKGEADLAVGNVTGESSERINSWRLFDAAFVIFVPQDHEILKDGSNAFDVDRLRRERLLFLNGVEATEDEMAHFAAAGLNVDEAHFVDSSRDMEALVKAKLGIGLAPACALVADDICHMRVGTLDLHRPVAVHAMSGRPRSREAATLLNLLRGADWMKWRG